MKPAREDEYLEFLAARAKALYRSAYVLAAGGTHRAEDLVQEAFSRCTRTGAGWPVRTARRRMPGQCTGGDNGSHAPKPNRGAVA